MKIMKANGKSFIAWMRSSLAGHLAFTGISFTPAVLGTLLYLNYEEGTLTKRWALYLVFMVLTLGAVLGVVFWYVGPNRRR